MPNPEFSEIAQALTHAWFPVARVVDIDAPQPITLLGKNLVAYRTDTGEPAVVAQRCPHRGGNFGLGQVVNGNIQCPYHGWQFDASGKCVLIPALGESAQIPSNAAISAYPAVERFGLVWTCLAEPFVDLPGLPELDEHNMTFLAGEPVDTRAGMLAALENFRDVAHFPFVHRATMGDVANQIETLHVRSDGFETWLSRNYSASGGEAAIYRDRADIVFTYHAVMPSLVSALLDEGPSGHRVVLECFAPVDAAGGCRIFLVSGVAGDYTAASAESALVTEMRVLSEDKPILDTVDPPEIPLHGEEVEVSVGADRYTLTTRRAYLRFVKFALQTGVKQECSA